MSTLTTWDQARIGQPLPYGKKVAARFIARANVCPDEWPGIWNAVNHDVGGYMSGLESQPIDDRPEPQRAPS